VLAPLLLGYAVAWGFGSAPRGRSDPPRGCAYLNAQELVVPALFAMCRIGTDDLFNGRS
jgi:hypothetical protein